ncbi:MAG: cardiolipin synthase [Verrucomicrobia bacterium]|nr:cardiolipin synthase [Verrucomicrobiota bacterium]
MVFLADIEAQEWSLIGLGYLIIQLGGLTAAAHVIMTTRSTQGTVAWFLFLITFPLIGLPMYLIFGMNKLNGYVRARRDKEQNLRPVVASFETGEENYAVTMPHAGGVWQALETLGRIRFTGQNHAHLMDCGKEIFQSMLSGIATAQRYIVVQFFIINDDSTGRQFADALMAKARNGVQVLLLYDEIGCRSTSASFWRDLRQSGVRVEAFGATGKLKNPWRLNFRNHRKVIIVDGHAAWVGGMNIGDEYLGESEEFGPWRDTHLRITGPTVQGIQIAFLEDWFWVTGTVPDLEWHMEPAPEGSDMCMLPLPSGPDDETSVWLLAFLGAIHAARERIWIHSPYFVPDEQIVAALQLAALRGVDVRITLPEKPDHLLVWLSSFHFIALPALRQVRFFRYQPGFLHSKVVLVDEHLAAIGTANLDNRSLSINFEIMMMITDSGFCAEVASMLTKDFTNCREVSHEEYHQRSLPFRIAVRAARLLAPVQ